MSEYEGITGELREAVGLDRGMCYVREERFERLCDAIDAVHAGLEKENEALKERDEGLPEQVDAKVRHIPDELREWCKNQSLLCDRWKMQLTDIVDRLESECQLVAATQWMRGLKYAHSDDGLREYGLVSLPVDADGEYIRIGDVMECVFNGEKRQFPVSYLNMESDGWHVYLAVNDCVRQGYKPSELLHYRPDTWERILADAMGCEPNEVAEDDDLMKLVARCKALAGEME